MTFRSASPHAVSRMRRAVDIGFGILMSVSVWRYVSRHELSAYGAVVLTLAAAVSVSYALAAVSRPDQRLASAGVLVATALWAPLTILAPSFSWCAFALMVSVYRVLRGWAALAVAATIVLAVSTGLLLVSHGQDLGLVLGPFFGGLVLSSAYAALDRTIGSQRQLIAELTATRELLARSERAAGAATERERMASDLHDTTVQHAASALLLLESDALRPGGSTAAVAESTDLLRVALEDTRRLLRDPADTEHVPRMVVDVVRAEARAAGAEFVTNGVSRPVRSDVVSALQRVVREALRNVAKHADACHVRVTLLVDERAVTVTVADDGVGFRPDRADRVDGLDAPAGRFGLRAMAWRAENVGGTLTVDSSPGGGTQVTISLPSGDGRLRR